MLRRNRSLQMQSQTGLMENRTGCFCSQWYNWFRNVLSNLLNDRSFIPHLYSCNTCYLSSRHTSGEKDKPCTNETPSIPPSCPMTLHLKKESFNNFPNHHVPGKPGAILTLYKNNSGRAIKTYIWQGVQKFFYRLALSFLVHCLLFCL